MTTPGAPRSCTHGTQCANIPNILRTGLSCHADDTPNKRGRQLVHGCPYLLGNNRIQSGLRVDFNVLILISLKNLLRDRVAVWRSATDFIKMAGRSGVLPPTHIVQLIGILPNSDQCKYSRVGHAWVNPLYMWDNERRNLRDVTLGDLHEIPNYASSLKD
eukprot:8486367-Pyramimonas_sp.AAC.1